MPLPIEATYGFISVIIHLSLAGILYLWSDFFSTKVFECIMNTVVSMFISSEVIVISYYLLTHAGAK